MRVQKILAETVGTFVLTVAVGLSLAHPLPLATPLVAALTLGIFVYAIGNVSGAHLNPAVTLGLWSTKTIRLADAFLYIVAQLIGAVLGQQFLPFLADRELAVAAENTVIIGVAEALGAAMLVFAVSAAVAGMVPKSASGITIGGALLLGILLASSQSNGVVNPAVALGIGSLSAAYLLGPVVGGIVGARLYQWLIRP